MWLFDDLLKKPSNSISSSGWSSGSSSHDPLSEEENTPLKIEKTEETFLQTEEPINVPTTPEPPKVMATAEEDTSSIIIGAETSSGNAPSGEVEEVSFITNVSPASENPVLVSEDSPTEKIEQGTNSLLDVLGEDSEEKEEAQDSKSEVEVVEAREETSSESPLVASENISDTSFVFEDTTKETEQSAVFHPEEFIDESLVKIESMIAAIDARHEAKLSEAEGYRSEKERFAELEQKAHDEADMMITERNHAERMKNYFMNEKNNQIDTVASSGSEQKTSVETTLTGLAVQNAVTTTVETKTEIKAANTPVEESSILSLAA